MEFVFIIAILIMSVVIHEVSHGFMALWLGDQTAKYQGRLTMNPIKHLDIFGSIIVPILGYMTGGIIIGWAKPVPFNPYNLRNQRWGEALVAIAGPLSNIIIAIIFSLILRTSFIYGFASNGFVFITSYVVMTNLVLAIFNLTPIPPLDGSKVLFSLFPNSLYRFRGYIESYGLVLVVLFIFFFSSVLSPISSYLFSVLTGLPTL